jgi:hypothetical protein
MESGQIRVSKFHVRYFDNYMRLQNNYNELNDGYVDGNYYFNVIVTAQSCCMQAYS